MRRELGSLERVLEHRVRLAIAVLLTRYDRLSFSRIKELTDETDGNLGANLRRLEDDGFVSATKEFVARKPVTWYSITARGRQALDAHLAALSRMIAQVGTPAEDGQ